MSKATYPSKRDIKFYMAEDIRAEINGKVSLIGMVPGDHFYVGGPSPSPDIAFNVSGLSFLFVLFGDPAGSFPARFRIVAPDRKTVVFVAESATRIEKLKNKPAAFGTSCKPFMGPAFGTYSMQLQIGDAKLSFPFIVDRGPPQPPPQPIKKRSRLTEPREA